MNRRNPKMIAGLLVMGALVVTLAARAATITSDLAGWWLFDETYGITANDSSGNANNGLISGAALFTSDVTRGYVLSFDGISGQANIPYNQVLEPAAGTVTIWVKPTLATVGDVVQHGTDSLARCQRTGTWYAYGLRIQKNGAPVAIFANDKPKTCSRQPQILVTGPASSAPLNKWTNLAMRWDGVGTLSLFVNGKKAGSTRYSPTPGTGLSYHGNFPVQVGAGLVGTDLEYAGMVDDLRVYSSALSDAEIKSIYLGQ